MTEWIPATIFFALLFAMVYWYAQVRRKIPKALFPEATTLVGVRGWLRFFCIILVFLHPLVLLSSLDFRAAEEVQAEYPRAMTIALINSVAAIALIVYSIYTGVRLWWVRPAAVANAKRFLIIVWTYSLMFRLSIFTVGFPREVNMFEARRFLWQFPIFSLHVLAWWMYLTRSKRVAATYAVERAESCAVST